MKNFFLIFILVLAGCKDKNLNSDVLDVQVDRVAIDIQIPKNILSQIEEEALSESKTIAAVYSFVPLTVQLNQASMGVLSKPVVKLNFPKGGGHIDLKDFVTGEGSFYLSFPEEQFNDLAEIMHLFYISNSPVKKIENENFGLGCGKMIDLKSTFSKLQKKDYLKVNTSGLRYLHVLAGHYIFVLKKSSQIYLSQVTITDSRHDKELCLKEESK